MYTFGAGLGVEELEEIAGEINAQIEGVANRPVE